MNHFFASSMPFPEHPLWEKVAERGTFVSFDLEITARCNNNCKHCYINLPAADANAKRKELSLEEIKEIGDEAVSLGALWCTLTGGEPLLREDFIDIYLYLKKKGLLVSVFTNATLITKEHVRLFQKYPPRDVEVTVYGVTPSIYEKVTRRDGSFSAFARGLDLLLRNNDKINLKAMALKSNVNELSEIACFCRTRSKRIFRFDPHLYLRFDGDPIRNREIQAERLSPAEIASIEKSDPERFVALRNERDHLIIARGGEGPGDHLFYCGLGLLYIAISYDGILRLCPLLWHPDCIYDLRKGNLTKAYKTLVLAVRSMRGQNKEFLRTCPVCPLVNLCMRCPASSLLECGRFEARVEYFCEVAQARAELIDPNRDKESSQ